jgi:hypothetical protein
MISKKVRTEIGALVCVTERYYIDSVLYAMDKKKDRKLVGLQFLVGTNSR